MPTIINAKCGPCTACCTALGVKKLDKPAYQTCKHVCASGCGIYKKRPGECKTYQCLWLKANSFDEQYRPDNLGIILEASETPVGIAIIVRELYSGAHKEEAANQFIYLIASRAQAFVYVVFDKERKLILPPWSEHLKDQIIVAMKDYK